MSQLIDKFHRASSGAAPPMGFRTARSTSTSPKLLLLVSLTGDHPGKSGNYTGADAALLRTAENPGEKDLRKIAGSFGDMPWGLYLEDDSEALAEKTGGLGLDFVVFSTAGRVTAVPQDKKIGKVLEVDSSMDDGLLRAINHLPVDAVLLADGLESGPLLWHQLLIFEHLAAMFPKPLIVPAPPDLSSGEMEALWNTGVDGILVASESAKVDDFKALRQAIDALRPRSERKGTGPRVILPRAAAGAQPAAPPDEEEEEEE